MIGSTIHRWTWLVVAFAGLAYAMAIAGDYVFDDIHSVSANPALYDLGNFWRYWSDPGAFSGNGARMYRPALLTSFALNMAVSPAAWSLKCGNLLLHAGCCALLFRWLWSLMRNRRAAFVASSLFAVHPLASEAINLVSARSELLAVFGIVLALHAQVGWQRRSRAGGAIATMMFGTVLACGSKETGVVLPALMVVQAFVLRHRWPRRSDLVRGLAAWLPVVALVVGYLVVRKTLLGQAVVAELGGSGEDPAHGYGRSLTTQLATMGALLPRMLWQVAAPFDLTIDPQFRYRHSLLDPIALLGWASMVGVTIGALWPGPRARLLRLGALVAAAIAAPWVLIPLNMPFAEHRFYGPLLGLAVMLCPLVPRVRRACRGVRPVHLQCAFAALLALGAVRSAARSFVYRDEVTLWQTELARNPASFQSWWGIGTTYLRKNQIELAIEPLARAHALCPTNRNTLRHYTEALVSLPDEQAQPHRSLAVAAQLLVVLPNDPWTRTLVAKAHLQAGRCLDDDEQCLEAERVALSCLEIAKPKGYVYQIAAEARQALGDLDGALAHLDTSIARGLDTLGVRLDKVRLLQNGGRMREARREVFALQRRHPTEPQVFALLRELAAPPR